MFLRVEVTFIKEETARPPKTDTSGNTLSDDKNGFTQSHTHLLVKSLTCGTAASIEKPECGHLTAYRLLTHMQMEWRWPH